MSHNEHHLSPHGQPAPASPAEYGIALPPSQASRAQPADFSGQGAESVRPAVGETMPNPGELTLSEKWAVQASDPQFNALSGAVAGFTSGVVTCPLDVIKTKLQAQGGFIAQGAEHRHTRIYKGLFGTASVIWREEGLRGLYRGLGPIVMGYLPTWAVWFTVYNKSKKLVGQYQRRSAGFPGERQPRMLTRVPQKTTWPSTSGHPSSPGPAAPLSPTRSGL